ncbi:MAG TPA: hypothetical protein VJG32_18060 [Anaerolineae bacterium]|nr:hypothetical protein [Anaerolineae bacterium]
MIVGCGLAIVIGFLLLAAGVFQSQDSLGYVMAAGMLMLVLSTSAHLHVMRRRDPSLAETPEAKASRAGQEGSATILIVVFGILAASYISVQLGNGPGTFVELYPFGAALLLAIGVFDWLRKLGRKPKRQSTMLESAAKLSAEIDMLPVKQTSKVVNALFIIIALAAAAAMISQLNQ